MIKTLKMIVVILSVVGFTSVQAFADETVKEKATATKNDAKRAVKKGAHRVGEKLCVDSDTACAAKKAGNRIEEAKDGVKDKTSEVINKVD